MIMKEVPAPVPLKEIIVVREEKITADVVHDA